MATTTAKNSVNNNRVNNQYAAVAEYAQEVFAKYVVCAEGYGMPMTAKDVVKWMGKSFVRIDTDKAGAKEQRTIEGDGYKVCVCPETVFSTLVQLEKLLKVKTASRAVFLHEYEVAEEDVLGVCTLPEDTKTLVKCAACRYDLRLQMTGVYLDFVAEKAVASDGHVLQVVPLAVSMRPEGYDGVIVPADFAARHAGEELKVCKDPSRKTDDKKYNDEAVYALCGKERVRLIEGRYPNWKSVVPKYEDWQYISLGKAWPQFRTALTTLKDVCADGLVKLYAEQGETVLHLKAEDKDSGNVMEREVQFDAPMPYAFCIGMNGAHASLIKDADCLGMEDSSRAMMFGCEDGFTLVMPMLIVDEDAPMWRIQKPAEAQPLEALINGVWERVEALTMSGKRMLVRRENGQRAIVKLEDLRGNIVENHDTEGTEKTEDTKPVCAQPEQPEMPAQPEQPETTAQPESTAQPEAEDDRVFVAEYSEKAVILTGNTKAFRKELKKYAFWHRNRQGWVLSKKRWVWAQELLGDKLCTVGTESTEKTEDTGAVKVVEVVEPVCAQPEQPEIPETPVQPEPLTPMMKQFRDLKAKYPDALILFRCGDFYEAYEEDAEACADILGITLTKQGSMRMAGFPYHALDTYLPRLIRNGKRVAICDQLEAPKTRKTA